MSFVSKDDRREPIGEEASPPVVAIVEPAGVEAVEPVHAAREVLELCLNDEVVMGSHQAVGVARPCETGGAPSQESNEVRPIFVVDEQRMAPGRAGGDMV